MEHRQEYLMKQALATCWLLVLWWLLMGSRVTVETYLMSVSMSVFSKEDLTERGRPTLNVRVVIPWSSSLGSQANRKKKVS